MEGNTVEEEGRNTVPCTRIPDLHRAVATPGSYVSVIG